MDLVVESAVGPGQRSSVCCVGGLDESLFGGAVLEHADHADQLGVHFLQVQVSDFLVGDRLPEHRRQVQGEVSTGSEAAAHQRSNELEQTKVVGAVGFGVDHPFGFVLSGLMPVVGRRNEQS